MSEVNVNTTTSILYVHLFHSPALITAGEKSMEKQGGGG